MGHHTSIIFYEAETSSWVLYDRKDNLSRAVAQSAENSLLLGLHVFDFTQVREDKCATSVESKLILVKLSSCKEGQFTCNDGQCVTMDERCNQISNCRDESDEDGCKMLIMKENYNEKIAPFNYDYDAEKILPVDVNISMAVMDILDIREVDLVYVLKFRLLMEWYDYRLRYHNLKLERSANLLTREEIDRLWIPFMVFSNTANNEATQGAANSEVTVSREGNFTRSPRNVLEEIDIFTGDDNKIIFDQVYSKTFKCEYQLDMYPFDTQVGRRTESQAKVLCFVCTSRSFNIL